MQWLHPCGGGNLCAPLFCILLWASCGVLARPALPLSTAHGLSCTTSIFDLFPQSPSEHFGFVLLFRILKPIESGDTTAACTPPPLPPCIILPCSCTVPFALTLQALVIVRGWRPFHKMYPPSSLTLTCVCVCVCFHQACQLHRSVRSWHRCVHYCCLSAVALPPKLTLNERGFWYIAPTPVFPVFSSDRSTWLPRPVTMAAETEGEQEGEEGHMFVCTLGVSLWLARREMRAPWVRSMQCSKEETQVHAFRGPLRVSDEGARSAAGPRRLLACCTAVGAKTRLEPFRVSIVTFFANNIDGSSRLWHRLHTVRVNP